jgi:hypothetical protein
MSKIVLSLNEEHRITSACVMLPKGNYNGLPIVDSLPDGDILDYLYVDGEFIYSPIPKEEESAETPSKLDIIEAQVTYTAMMTDTLLEV